MINLIKMDLRRLFLSKVFFITMSITALLNIVILSVIPLVTKMFMPDAETQVVQLSSVLTNPFVIGWMIILMFVSVVSYSYADMANGYIKNIAGQISRRSDTILSKFVVIGVHNLIFIAVAALSVVLGQVIGSSFGTYTIAFDAQVPGGILTLVLKWLLSMAVCSILLFFTTAVRNKTLAAIVGVIFGTNTLGLVYGGLNFAVSQAFHTRSFDLGMYMPDSLLQSVNAVQNIGVLNSVIASAVCIALFLILTVRVFNARDIK